MKRRQKRVAIAWVLGVLFQSFQIVPHVEAQIPAEYKPNYKFAAERDKIQETNDLIRSNRRSWKAIQVSYFSQLLKNYNIVFQYLPKEYKSTYEDCRQLTEVLSIEYDPSKWANYENNCLSPLNEIFKEISNTHSVRAKIIANPMQWSAPLTVTFDGRWSSDDASRTTIPSDNYFWYYTDTAWIEQSIGRWPVLKHTFKKEGNYVVHLTVRSANAASEWIFDGQADVNINVWPQAAKLIVFVNGKRLKEELPIKFTSQEAIDGLRVDGSATSPLWGRAIQKHDWEIINSSNEILYKNGGSGAPSSFRLKLQANGLYSATLKIQDNENNTVESKYDIIIADPIATIKASPVDGNTSSIYSFDASTSYSVQSALKSYTWTITDEDGNEIANQNGKTLQQKFTKPWTYRVKLRVLDELGNDNEEALTLQVWSTPPIPQFTMEASKQWSKPSQFILDASPSYDIDTINDNDALSYEWTFSNNDNVAVDKKFDDNKRVTVSFREKGTYKITLTVKDRYGKIEQTTKDVTIDSSLRPYIFANPISTRLGESTSFSVKTPNKLIANYKWDFWDGATRTMSEDKVVHTYKKVGTYKVRLTASTAEWEENDVAMNVFIGEANSPIPAYVITNQKSETIIPEGLCTDKGWDKYPAYLVERYEEINIDWTESVNIQWWKDNIIYYYRPQQWQTSKVQQLRQRFDEVGCQFVDFTIEDTAANKTASSRIRFFVTNSKPSFQNVLMTFPQVGNTYGIGIGQNTNKDVLKVDIDPLVVKIDAVNALDKDGSISKFKWYYYNVDDPDRLLEIKYTPGNTPFAYFSVPRISGEFRFGVEAYDNDGESTRSEDSLGKGPVVFFPPDSKNPDIPIVTLKVDRWNAKVWEEITLEAIAKITSSRNDFSTNSTYSFDLDGDGTWDRVTKDNKITHTYKVPWNYTPKAKVTYRSRSGIAYGDTIAVEKWIKAGFLYWVVWNTIVVRDTSYGDIDSRKFCADRRICRNNPSWIIENQSYFTKSYEKPGPYMVRYDVQDKNGNTSSVWQQVVTINAPLAEDAIWILTLPAPNKNWSVSVGKILDNKVLFYVGYNGKWECYIDTDITRSSNATKKADQDRDIGCNVESLFSYKPSVWSTIARVYYGVGENVLTKDIPIQFLDYDVQLSPEQKEIYNTLDGIMNQIWDNEPELKSALLQLRNSVAEGDDTSSLVLSIKDILENKWDSIPWSIRSPIEELLARLENETTCSAEWCNTYKLSKMGIISLFSTERKADVAKIFEDIDNAAGDKTEIKQLLDKITAIGVEELNKKKLETEDMNQLKLEICKIVSYYEITWTSCKLPEGDFTGAVADGPTVEVSSSNTSALWKVLKVVWIVAWILGVGFIILVIIFALKAKKKQEAAQ